jgi:hypothetical protein
MPEVATSLRIPCYASAPTVPAFGYVYYNSTNATVYYWNGSAWVALASGSVSGAWDTSLGIVVGTAAQGRTALTLNNVTNDAQTQAAVVPNTAPAGGEVLVGTGLGAYLKKAVSGSGATISLASTGVMTISAISDGAISSSGTWNTASSERRQWDGSSTNLVASTGRTSLGICEVYENSSIANQSLSTTDAYITGSMITVPAGIWAQGGQYRCIFDVAKTAGTGAIVINIRCGTAGTTSDASIFSTTYPAGTTVADQARFEVMLNFRAVGASATATGVVNSTKNIAATATGMWGIAAQNAVGAPATSGAFNSTTFTRLGVSFNGSTAFSGTVLLVQAEYKQ